MVAELPGRPGRARGHPRSGRGRTGSRVLEIGPGLGLLTGGLLDGGAEVTAIELDRGLAAYLRERFADRSTEGRSRSSRATRSTRTCRTGPAALPRRRQPAVPHHQPDLHRLLGRAAAAGAARPDGPARGRRADRGRREMSYLSVFVQYHATVRVALRVPPEAFEPEPAVESAVIVVEPYAPTTGSSGRRRGPSCGDSSRPASASGARCSTTCWRGSSASTPARAAALAAAGIAPDRRPQTLAVGDRRRGGRSTRSARLGADRRALGAPATATVATPGRPARAGQAQPDARRRRAPRRMGSTTSTRCSCRSPGRPAEPRAPAGGRADSLHVDGRGRRADR